LLSAAWLQVEVGRLESTSTVAELKALIHTQLGSLEPAQQHLVWAGCHLSHDEASLAEVGMLHGAVTVLMLECRVPPAPPPEDDTPVPTRESVALVVSAGRRAPPCHASPSGRGHRAPMPRARGRDLQLTGWAALDRCVGGASASPSSATGAYEAAAPVGSLRDIEAQLQSLLHAVASLSGVAEEGQPSRPAASPQDAAASASSTDPTAASVSGERTRAA
jgi:hypothetical protein